LFYVIKIVLAQKRFDFCSDDPRIPAPVGRIGVVLIIGSTIGGLLNYFIGLGGNKLVNKFRKKKNGKDVGSEKKGNRLLEKFGWGAIFFASWIPVIGDFILISAGAKKLKFTKFIAFMVSGKIVKTIAVVSGFALVF